MYVGNLPWKVGPQDLKEFMQSAGGEVAHVEVLRDGIGRSKGCGIVRFATAEQAQSGAFADPKAGEEGQASELRKRGRSEGDISHGQTITCAV